MKKYLIASTLLLGRVFAQEITTYVGNGTMETVCNVSVFEKMAMKYPLGIATDSIGNLFIADANNNVIRKKDLFGNITIIAGNGNAGFSGDGGKAVNASLSWPRGIALDKAGNLFIADYDNNRVRKVGLDGNITTVAGKGEAGHLGDGEFATKALLNHPISLAIDVNNNLLIADLSNNCIRKVNSEGIITTFAGTGEKGYGGDGDVATRAQLNKPTALACDGLGNLYIADWLNARIRKVDTKGIITTYGGKGIAGFGGDGGQANSAEINFPNALAIDKKGNLYLADEDNQRIRKIALDGIITTVAGNGQTTHGNIQSLATETGLYFPSSLTIDLFGNILVAENDQIRKISFNEEQPILFASIK